MRFLGLPQDNEGLKKDVLWGSVKEIERVTTESLKAISAAKFQEFPAMGERIGEKHIYEEGGGDEYFEEVRVEDEDLSY